jgi:cytochrome oxidase Cu insertion factor (SCO1/SenC/PrrC family)
MFASAVVALLVVAGFLAPSSLVAADRHALEIAKRSAPVGAGDVAPDFTLPDQDGRKHALSAERGKRPVVLIFYRGHW